MGSFSFARDCVVWNCNVREFCDLFINFRNLLRKFSHMANTKHLWLQDLWVYSQYWSNRKCSCFTSSIFALCNQIMELPLDCFSNQRYCHSLYFWWLQESHLLLDSLLNFSWYFEVFLVVPSCLMIDEGTRNIPSMLVYHKFHIFTCFLLKSLMLCCNLTFLLLWLFTFFFCFSFCCLKRLYHFYKISFIFYYHTL